MNADHTADIAITWAEENRVFIEKPLFFNLSEVAMPVPTVLVKTPYLHFFPVNSDALPDDEARKVLAWLDTEAPPGTDVRRELESKSPNSTIEVHGYASTTGKWADNDALAKRRAARLEQVLRTRLPNADIKVYPHGELTAGTPDETEDLYERRGEVWIRQYVWPR